MWPSMNNRNFRIPPCIISIACINRAIVLMALIGGVISVYSSDIVIELAARYVPTNGRSVLRAVSFFICYNHFYCVPIAIISSLVAYHVVSSIMKEKMKNFFFILIMAVSAYVCFALCVQKIPRPFFLVYLVVSATALLLVSMLSAEFMKHLHSFRIFCRNAFICIPFLIELFFPFAVIYYLSSARLRSHHLFNRIVCKAGPVYTAAAISMVICYLLTIAAISRLIIPLDIKGDASRIAKGNYYSLQLDRERNYLIASNAGKGLLEIYDVRQRVTKLFDVAIPTEELEVARINVEKKELYHFDRGRKKLLVYDLDSFNLKKESMGILEGGGSTLVAFDNASNTIAVAREDDFMWIVDMSTIQPIRALRIADWNDFIVFNKQLNAFILSYFSEHSFIQVVSPDGQKSKRIDAKRYQGGIASADRYHELFIALPLAGKIAVYDIPSLKLKRLVPTAFGARGIAYDSVHDLLIAASMCNGYVDIIDRKSGRICKKIFVGYWLREVCLNEYKREAYISSGLGGLFSLAY